MRIFGLVVILLAMASGDLTFYYLGKKVAYENLPCMTMRADRQCVWYSANGTLTSFTWIGSEAGEGKFSGLLSPQERGWAKGWGVPREKAVETETVSAPAGGAR